MKNTMLYEDLRLRSYELENIVSDKNDQLREQQSRLRAILDATGEGIIYLEDQLLQYVNPAFKQMMGYDTVDLFGQPLSMFVDAKYANERNTENVYRLESSELEVQRRILTLVRKDGRPVTVSMTFTMLEAEPSVRMVAIVRDVDREASLEKQRIAFISNAAHELRTPITSIMLRLHMLKRQPEDRPTHFEGLERATLHLKRIAEDLLEITRFENHAIQLNRKPTSLGHMLQEICEQYREKAARENVTLNWTKVPENLVAHIDNQRISRAIGYLIDNGIYMAESGRSLRLRMGMDESYMSVHIIIEHEGDTFEETLLPDMIFEPFSQPSMGESDESGMSLSIAKRFIEIHGGKVTATNSADGQGGRFNVHLPLKGSSTGTITASLRMDE